MQAGKQHTKNSMLSNITKTLNLVKPYIKVPTFSFTWHNHLWKFWLTTKETNRFKCRLIQSTFWLHVYYATFLCYINRYFKKIITGQKPWSVKVKPTMSSKRKWIGVCKRKWIRVCIQLILKGCSLPHSPNSTLNFYSFIWTMKRVR